MIIAIDIGNTNVVIGGMRDETVLFTARLRTDPDKTDYEYAALLMELFALHRVNLAEIEGAIISSVVPPLSAAIQNAVEKITAKRPLLVGAGVKTGLNILTDNPARVGSDMIVGAVAALARYPRPILIFDLGTATTLAVLDKSGDYIGYMIIPGLRSSVQALAAGTSQLPHISLDPPEALLGKNTVDAMRAGAIYGSAAMLDGLIDRVERQLLGGPATVVATGGLTGRVAPLCQHKIFCDDDLILRGLALLYRKNTPISKAKPQ